VPQTPLGDLTALFRSRRFSGGLLLRRGKRREGRNKEKRGARCRCLPAATQSLCASMDLCLSSEASTSHQKFIIDIKRYNISVSKLMQKRIF